MNNSNNSTINENGVSSTNNTQSTSGSLPGYSFSLDFANNRNPDQVRFQTATTVAAPLALPYPLQQQNPLGIIGGSIRGNIIAPTPFVTPFDAIGTSRKFIGYCFAATLTYAFAPLWLPYDAAARLTPAWLGAPLAPPVAISCSSTNMQNRMANTQQSSVMRELAAQYAVSAEQAWEYARSTAVADKVMVPLPPSAVFSMVNKYSQCLKQYNENQLDDTAEQRSDGLLRPLQVGVSGIIPSTVATPPLSPQVPATITHTTGSGGSLTKRSRAEKISENESSTTGLPVLLPQPRCTAQIDQQQSTHGDSGDKVSQNLPYKAKTSSSRSAERPSHTEGQRSRFDSFSVSPKSRMRKAPMPPKHTLSPQAPSGQPSTSAPEYDVIGCVMMPRTPPCTEPGSSTQSVPSSDSRQYRAINVSGQASPGTSDEHVCVVCCDFTNGFHHGARICKGCEDFFRQTIIKKREYTCFKNSRCTVNIITRNRCRRCRFDKCLKMGMRTDSVRWVRNRSKKEEMTKNDTWGEDETRNLRAVIAQAYRAAYPKGLLIKRREDALERLQMFLDKISLMEAITWNNEEQKFLNKGLNATLVLRAMFTDDKNCVQIIGDQSRTMATFLEDLDFEVNEEQLALMTVCCLIQDLTGLTINRHEIEQIGAKVINCLQCSLTELVSVTGMSSADEAMCHLWFKMIRLIRDSAPRALTSQKSQPLPITIPSEEMNMGL